MNRLYKIVDALRQWFRSPLFGFVKGHDYFTNVDLERIKSLVGKTAKEEVTEFESRFAALVGDGIAVSFASGRMGFYVLMKILGIGPGDEVVIHGATCSVMVNAVLRTGAVPIFSDIDPETFGSSEEHILNCLSSRTRMIVAQHSFGIPCNIKPIVDLARSRQIFLMEDCALTLGSKINGVTVGNFGDAALFSTDHSKPLNTLTGGLIYTRDVSLAKKLLLEQVKTSELPGWKQLALWKRFLLERRYCHPAIYGRMALINLISIVQSKFIGSSRPFIDEDFSAVPSSSYPYPAKMPGFLAAIGIIETMRWPQVAEDRKKLLQTLLEVAEHSMLRPYIPKAYRDQELNIVPLRFAWAQTDGALIRERLSSFIDVSWTWFLQPIIATKEPLENFGYSMGTCQISERIGPDMINLPCNISPDDSRELVVLFQESIFPI